MSASEAQPATATPAEDGRPLIYICGLDPAALGDAHAELGVTP